MVLSRVLGIQLAVVAYVIDSELTLLRWLLVCSAQLSVEDVDITIGSKQGTIPRSTLELDQRTDQRRSNHWA